MMRSLTQLQKIFNSNCRRKCKTSNFLSVISLLTSSIMKVTEQSEVLLKFHLKPSLCCTTLFGNEHELLAKCYQLQINCHLVPITSCSVACRLQTTTKTGMVRPTQTFKSSDVALIRLCQFKLLLVRISIQFRVILIVPSCHLESCNQSVRKV